MLRVGILWLVCFSYNYRMDARVVEWARLESVCASDGTVGSNPTPSAILKCPPY